MSQFIFPKDVRAIINAALPEETAIFGQTPELRYTYVPAGHARALHPDNMLVVGIRGAGKSFWWSALQSKEHRNLVAELLPGAGIAGDTSVSSGFGERPSPDDYPGKDVLIRLIKDFDPRQIWRTIVLMHLPKQNKGKSPFDGKDWKGRISWLCEHPQEVEQLAYDADNYLANKNLFHLILFDALDRTADDWPSMFKLVRGLLQVLLEFRSYKRIRPKAFVRPDHLQDSSLAGFPDSSKVLNQKVELSWPRNELYSLFWHYLSNEPNQGNHFRADCTKGFHLEWTKQGNVWTIPEELQSDDDTQRAVFHAITGPWMGRDRRRGFPYTWLPGHLGDSRRQVSPRSFLAALHHAASDVAKIEYDYAMHFESIKRGVQAASMIRVREMQEDYPWVAELMKPLAGSSVPCSFADIEMCWKLESTLVKLQKSIKNKGVKLPPIHLEAGPNGVREDLEELGVFERMWDDRVNLPDVYRVGYGIGRRGGVRRIT